MMQMTAIDKARAQAEPAASFLAVVILLLGALSANGPVFATSAPAPIKAPTDRTPAVWLAPAMLEPADVGIGGRIHDLQLQGIGGESLHLADTGGRRGTVVVVRDPECPVSRRYGPRITAMARQFGDGGFGFVFIYPNAELDRGQRLEDARRLGIPGTYVERGSFALAEALDVKSTGEVFVLDADRRLRYRGAVDDQYGLGYTRDAPTRHYLRNALDAVRGGDEVTIPATSAPGCFIDADPSKDGLLPPLPGGQMLS
jgi:hypothetical protein